MACGWVQYEVLKFQLMFILGVDTLPIIHCIRIMWLSWLVETSISLVRYPDHVGKWRPYGHAFRISHHLFPDLYLEVKDEDAKSMFTSDDDHLKWPKHLTTQCIIYKPLVKMFCRISHSLVVQFFLHICYILGNTNKMVEGLIYWISMTIIYFA